MKEVPCRAFVIYGGELFYRMPHPICWLRMWRPSYRSYDVCRWASLAVAKPADDVVLNRADAVEFVGSGEVPYALARAEEAHELG